MFSTFSITISFISREKPPRKAGKTRKKVDSVAIGRATKHVINNKTKVRIVTHNFGILKTALSHYLLEFKE
jgi:hypothetical protein